MPPSKRTKKARVPKSASQQRPLMKKPIEQYDHTRAQRVNNPPVGLVTSDTDKEATTAKTYAYDPHLDPQLVWAGHAQQTSIICLMEAQCSHIAG